MHFLHSWHSLFAWVGSWRLITRTSTEKAQCGVGLICHKKWHCLCGIPSWALFPIAITPQNISFHLIRLLLAYAILPKPYNWYHTTSPVLPLSPQYLEVYLNLSQWDFSPWQVKLSDIRQSKILKEHIHLEWVKKQNFVSNFHKMIKNFRHLPFHYCTA